MGAAELIVLVIIGLIGYAIVKIIVKIIARLAAKEAVRIIQEQDERND